MLEGAARGAEVEGLAGGDVEAAVVDVAVGDEGVGGEVEVDAAVIDDVGVEVTRTATGAGGEVDDAGGLVGQAAGDDAQAGLVGVGGAFDDDAAGVGDAVAGREEGIEGLNGLDEQGRHAAVGGVAEAEGADGGRAVGGDRVGAVEGDADVVAGTGHGVGGPVGGGVPVAAGGVVPGGGAGLGLGGGGRAESHARGQQEDGAARMT